MITCNVCGHLNDSTRVTCEECGSDLSDSPDWGVDFDDNDDLNVDDFDDNDDLNVDDFDEIGYYDEGYFD